MATMQLHAYGKGSRHTVLVHGIPGSAATWDSVVPHLMSDRKVLVPDLIGFGDSERTEDIQALWAWQQARALATALDKAKVKKAGLVGHDFGGPVSLCFAALYPERVESLTLISCNAFGDTPIPFPLSGIFWPLVGKTWERMLFSAASLKMMIRNGRGKRSAPLNPENYVSDPAQTKAIAAIFGHALRNLPELYQPFPGILQNLEIPRQVIWGTEDPFFSLDQGRRTAEAAKTELRVIEGGGHFLPEEQPAAVAKLLKAL